MCSLKERQKGDITVSVNMRSHHEGAEASHFHQSGTAEQVMKCLSVHQGKFS